MVLPGQWWLPLPIYVEHCLIPLFTTAAVAGLWSGIRVIVSILNVCEAKERKSTRFGPVERLERTITSSMA